MSKTLNHLKICRYILIIGSIIGTLLHITPSLYPVFIFLSLLVFINSQVRITLLGNRLFIVSLLLEIVLVLYLHSLTGGYIYFIMFTTLMDTVTRLKDETYLLFAFIALALLYALYPLYSLEWITVILLFYIMTFLLLSQLQHELDTRIDTEELYDQLRKNNYELEAARARLLSYSKQVEKVSQLEERNRISRELHDSIGHNLTGILMQVDASMQILPLNQEKGMEILSSAYQNINNSIEGVRQTVRKLRPSTFQNHTTSLKDLVEKFQKDTGVHIELTSKGTPYPLYPSIEITLYKNTREAITNSVRHGHAHKIDIILNYTNEHLQLIITDDGIGATNIQKGFGLSGMEERLELVGGTINYSGDNGFCIQMTIPRREIE